MSGGRGKVLIADLVHRSETTATYCKVRIFHGVTPQFLRQATDGSSGSGLFEDPEAKADGAEAGPDPSQGRPAIGPRGMARRPRDGSLPPGRERSAAIAARLCPPH